MAERDREDKGKKGLLSTKLDERKRAASPRENRTREGESSLCFAKRSLMKRGEDKPRESSGGTKFLSGNKLHSIGEKCCGAKGLIH